MSEGTHDNQCEMYGEACACSLRAAMTKLAEKWETYATRRRGLGHWRDDKAEAARDCAAQLRRAMEGK